MSKVRMTPTLLETSIMNGSLYFEDVKQCDLGDESFEELIEHKSVKTIRLVSLSSTWMETSWIDYDSKIRAEINMQMTLRKEVRSGRNYWYAYRRVLGKLHKKFVGQSQDLTAEKLLKIARVMPSI